MKKHLLFSLCLMVFFGFNINAQSTFNEGVLTYDITVKGSEKIPPGFENAKMILYLKTGQSRKEFVTGIGTETTVFDNNAGKGFILKEFSGQKLMITLGTADWDLLNKKNQEASFSIDEDKVDVAGIQCKKAVATFSDGKTMVIYFDPNTSISNKKYSNGFPQLSGVPVQYELQSGNLSFVYTLKTIVPSTVSTSKFEMPRSGFRVMTFEENQQLKKSSL